MRANAQQGITIIEVLGALAISSLMLIGLTTMINASMEDSKGQQAALHQSQFVAAVTKYINNPTNFFTITGAGAGVTTEIELPTLKSAGLLPATFPTTNVYRQTTCAIAKLRGLAASDNQKLDVLIVTAGGDPIGAGDIPAVAANAGPGNGYITETTARGASWSLDAAGLSAFFTGTMCAGVTAIPGNGHLASALFFDGPGQLSTDFLYRSKLPGFGREKLNAMNTPLLLDNAAVVAEGDACTGKGIAVNANHELLNCDIGGRWRVLGINSVPNFGALPMTGNTDGDVRMIRSPFYRAFAWKAIPAPGIWVPLAADEKNDFEANDINATNNVRASKDVSAGEGVYGEYVVTGAVVMTSSYLPEAPCNISTIDPATGLTAIINPIGTFVIDANNRWLVCASDMTFRYQNGTYVPP